MFKLSAHLGYQFTEWPLEERLAAAARNGFSAVEHPSPYGIQAARMTQLLAAFELEFVQLACPSGDASKGEKGLAALPDREFEHRDSVEAGIAYAKTVGARYLHVMAGIVRPDLDRKALWPLYIANLRDAADRMADHEIELLIEPIGPGTIANYFMDDPELAVRALTEIGRPNVRLLFDTFHAAGAGLDCLSFIEAHHSLIAHIHIADWPGRHEPGTGDLPFAAILKLLTEGGYDGYLGCEYVPKGETESGLSWRDSFMS